MKKNLILIASLLMLGTLGSLYGQKAYELLTRKYGLIDVLKYRR